MKNSITDSIQSFSEGFAGAFKTAKEAPSSLVAGAKKVSLRAAEAFEDPLARFNLENNETIGVMKRADDHARRAIQTKKRISPAEQKAPIIGKAR
jgi:hypothetical protein